MFVWRGLGAHLNSIFCSLLVCFNTSFSPIASTIVMRTKGPFLDIWLDIYATRNDTPWWPLEVNGSKNHIVAAETPLGNTHDSQYLSTHTHHTTFQQSFLPLSCVQFSRYTVASTRQEIPTSIYLFSTPRCPNSTMWARNFQLDMMHRVCILTLCACSLVLRFLLVFWRTLSTIELSAKKKRLCHKRRCWATRYLAWQRDQPSWITGTRTILRNVDHQRWTTCRRAWHYYTNGCICWDTRVSSNYELFKGLLWV